MASLTKVHGNSKVFYAGKEIALTKLAKSNLTQDELDQALAFIQLTATIVGVGDDTAGGFNAGASDEVHVLSEGIAPVAGSDFGGVTGVTASVVSLFN
ncbi:MAG: hypothetical protein CBD31_01650 [Flavobacteriaceae bacterium TMED171]|nr:MAG: hypothetical protein CBD31_01650 [Flavobacteriaceae bacterium TMED171]|tara:strand:- start:141 stop:434 length:294 start_codon:yes stop_codon:yes gene_type:complete